MGRLGGALDSLGRVRRPEEAMTTFRIAVPLALAIIISELAGLIGSFFTVSAIPDWYEPLVKPALVPPNWIFGPVWTTLYLLMGIAAFLVWRRGWERREVKKALILFGIQLVLNAAWSVIFFGFRSPGVALAEIMLLWFAIAATIAAFAGVSRIAALLLLPYILWVSFAVYLNFSIWMLN